MTMYLKSVSEKSHEIELPDLGEVQKMIERLKSASGNISEPPVLRDMEKTKHIECVSKESSKIKAPDLRELEKVVLHIEKVKQFKTTLYPPQHDGIVEVLKTKPPNIGMKSYKDPYILLGVFTHIDPFSIVRPIRR